MVITNLSTLPLFFDYYFKFYPTTTTLHKAETFYQLLMTSNYCLLKYERYNSDDFFYIKNEQQNSLFILNTSHIKQFYLNDILTF